ncbi:hypothetical protein A2Z22_03030 [Candidatus Woesebacteria bacterium RBG_16_34_12]|uniref:Uncharacterized protein n=1 Tax=Candidatus Woesebacteria bacterium RBG_16_34_12 TaxID=1802480 RepID=A0A1F7X6X5_9BACT|nr:MAG: hypothetical protein A2Z22_03030 [Candidatus Woesebacteria bacterium RBG_16_34_12]
MRREKAELEFQKAIEEAETFVGYFSKQELLMMNLAALCTYQVTGKTIDKSIAGVMLKATLNKEIFSMDELRGFREKREETLRNSKIVRSKDEKWGLVHGHYSRFTLAQIVGFVVARRQCNKLAVLLESSERSLKFKGREAEISDKDRGNILLASGLADEVEIIKGDRYDDEFYREIIKLTKPEVYFGNQEWDEERRREGELRAGLVGAEIILLPEVKGSHLSDVEDLLA